MATTNHCATDLTQVPRLLEVPKDGPRRSAGEGDAAIPDDAVQKTAFQKVCSKISTSKRSDRRTRCVLDGKWERADRYIRKASAQLRERTGHPQGDLAYFASSQTLIQTSLQEAESSLAETRKLPQVETANAPGV